MYIFNFVISIITFVNKTYSKCRKFTKNLRVSTDVFTNKIYRVINYLTKLNLAQVKKFSFKFFIRAGGSFDLILLLF